MNGAGSELPNFPLEEYRRRLKMANGTIINVMDKFPEEKSRLEFVNVMQRYGAHEFDIRSKPIYHIPRRDMSKFKKKFPPKKALRNVALEPSMVEFIINSETSWELLNFAMTMQVPDEHFYPTIMEKAIEAGAIKAVKANDVCMRATIWIYNGKPFCNGKTIRNICNFDLKDLKGVRETNCLTLNKFNLDVDPIAVMCQLKYLRD